MRIKTAIAVGLLSLSFWAPVNAEEITASSEQQFKVPGVVASECPPTNSDAQSSDSDKLPSAQRINSQSDVCLNVGSIYAAVWQTLSAECRALCYQTYNCATAALRTKIENGNYVKRNGKLYRDKLVTLPGCKPRLESRPLAIILDIDETVIDNSDLAIWLALHSNCDVNAATNAFFTYQALHPEVVKEVPGVCRFLRQCSDWGITPIFITDRDKSLHLATVQALQNLGLDATDLYKRVLLRDKKQDKAHAIALAEQLHLQPDSRAYRDLLHNASNKPARRVMIEQQYEVIGYFGDDLYDHPIYVSKEQKNTQETHFARLGEVRNNFSRFGNDWFILPNAFYGSWLYKSGLSSATPEAVVRIFQSNPAVQKFHEWYLREQQVAK